MNKFALIAMCASLLAASAHAEDTPKPEGQGNVTVEGTVTKAEPQKKDGKDDSGRHDKDEVPGDRH